MAGRPLKFKSPEELEKKIAEYFEYCDNRTKKEIVKTKDYYEIIDMPDPVPYTVYGLADFLDCESDTLLNYQDKDDFSVYIARAKHKILTNKVVRGLDGKSNPMITKFLLTANYGITDNQEKSDDKNININIQYPPNA